MPYTPPGVYPRKIRNAGLLGLIAGARIPVIVGRGQRTLLVEDEAVVHGGAGYTDEMSVAATSIVRIGDYPGQEKYVATTDYLFTGSMTTPSANLDWTPGGSEPTVGATYYVTYYKLVDASVQYEYGLYTDESLIRYTYGDESSTNLLTVGALVTLANGAPAVGCLQLNLESSVDPDNPTALELQTAFAAVVPKLAELRRDQCRYIVPMNTALPTSMGGTGDIFTEGTAPYIDHVDQMSMKEERLWRMIVRGIPEASSDNNSTVRSRFNSLITGYNAYGTGHDGARRIVVVTPDYCYRTIDGTSVKFDGSVVAAAAAGRICSYTNPAVSLTNKELAGITIERNFSNADLNLMATNGACHIYNEGILVKCRHGLTCIGSSGNANTQEVSVVEIEDEVKRSAIAALENRYKGELIVDGFVNDVVLSTAAAWKLLTKSKTIADYGTPTGQQDPDEPRKINVSGRIQPAYPGNWFDVDFMFVSTV